jgi:hypothetical protein
MLLPDLHPLQAAHKLRTLVLDVDDVLVRLRLRLQPQHLCTSHLTHHCTCM